MKTHGEERTRPHHRFSGPRYRGSNPCPPAKLQAYTRQRLMSVVRRHCAMSEALAETRMRHGGGFSSSAPTSRRRRPRRFRPNLAALEQRPVHSGTSTLVERIHPRFSRQMEGLSLNSEPNRASHPSPIDEYRFVRQSIGVGTKQGHKIVAQGSPLAAVAELRLFRNVTRAPNSTTHVRRRDCLGGLPQ